MNEVVRSPRAEKARDWFWTAFSIGALLNLCVEVFGMDFLKDGWSLVPRIALAVVWTVAGGTWAWETYKRGRDDGVVTYYGSISNVPYDHDERARNAEETTCHVCDAPADVVMEVLVEEANLGSAIFLCDHDLDLVARGDVESLGRRMAVTYEEPASETAATASLMVNSTGRSVRLSHR